MSVLRGHLSRELAFVKTSQMTNKSPPASCTAATGVTVCAALFRFPGQTKASLSGQHNFLTLEMETNAPLAQAKLVLLGDMGAGKSSLVLRFVK